MKSVVSLRWMMLGLLGFLGVILVGCGTNDTFMTGIQNEIEYVPYQTTIPQTMTIHYKARMIVETGVNHTLDITTTGILTSSLSTVSFGPIPYEKEISVPLTLNILGKGEGSMIIIHRAPKGFTAKKYVYILATDAGIVLSDDRGPGTYLQYLISLQQNKLITDAQYSDRVDYLVETGTLTVTIDGHLTVLDSAQSPLFDK